MIVRLIGSLLFLFLTSVSYAEWVLPYSAGSDTDLFLKYIGSPAEVTALTGIPSGVSGTGFATNSQLVSGSGSGADLFTAGSMAYYVVYAQAIRSNPQVVVGSGLQFNVVVGGCRRLT